MDAIDTCVTTSLKLSDFSVSSEDAVESNFSGKGLIDGINEAYMVSGKLTETLDAAGEVVDSGVVLKTYRF